MKHTFSFEVDTKAVGDAFAEFRTEATGRADVDKQLDKQAALTTSLLPLFKQMTDVLDITSEGIHATIMLTSATCMMNAAKHGDMKARLELQKLIIFIGHRMTGLFPGESDLSSNDRNPRF